MNQITDNWNNVRTENYTYDEQYRLKAVNYGDGETQAYAFDAMGNRTNKTDTVGGSPSTEGYNFDNANRLTSQTVAGTTVTYVNDFNGNTLVKRGRKMWWDSQNRLVSCLTGAGTSKFKYGSDGLRRRMVYTNNNNDKSQTDYALDGQNVVQEIVQQQAAGGTWNNPTTITYLQGPSGPLYRAPQTATDVRWYVYDGLGSVVGEVDPNGNVTASKKFDVYGATRGTVGTSTTKHGFVGGLGHQSDDETGLVYMRARYYDPALGRFANEDSAHDGANWFIYCVNDPVNKVDESGQTGRALEWALNFVKRWDAFAAGVWCAGMCCAMAWNVEGFGVEGVLGFMLAAEFGLIAAVCFGLSLGGSNANGVFAGCVGLMTIILGIVAGQKGAKMGSGASAIAYSAVAAVGGYGLMLVGCLAVDFAEGL